MSQFSWVGGLFEASEDNAVKETVSEGDHDFFGFIVNRARMLTAWRCWMTWRTYLHYHVYLIVEDVQLLDKIAFENGLVLSILSDSEKNDAVDVEREQIASQISFNNHDVCALLIFPLTTGLQILASHQLNDLIHIKFIITFRPSHISVRLCNMATTEFHLHGSLEWPENSLHWDLSTVKCFITYVSVLGNEQGIPSSAVL